jgi:2-polyprenyl-3-methyl-5-hydroxy-6-metoxy-1,4-benzoquinol methylase
MNEASIAHSGEVRAAERFEFGRNWREFLHLLTEERIVKAENSLRDALGIQTLEDKTFLDVGSGSGLLSLAARRLGAEVRSFDYDPESVACTSELKSAFFSEDAHWRVEQASALNKEYLKGLGTFDVVYSWGVLHHTGAMWDALENMTGLVREVYPMWGGNRRAIGRGKFGFFLFREEKRIVLVCIRNECRLLGPS